MKKMILLSLALLAAASSAQETTVQATLVKTYSLPNSYEKGGFFLSILSGPTGGGVPHDKRPIWFYDGRHYFTDPDTMITNVFDADFRLVKTIQPTSKRKMSDVAGYSTSLAFSARAQGGDFIFSDKGVIYRYSLDGKLRAKLDLKKEYIENHGEEYPDIEGRWRKGINLSYVLKKNGDDCLVLDVVDRSYYAITGILTQDGVFIREEEQIREYARQQLESFGWISQRPDLLKKLDAALDEEVSFFGESFVSDGISSLFVSYMTELFTKEGIDLDVSDVMTPVLPGAHGVWARSRSDLSQIYYFNIVTTVYEKISGIDLGDMTIWDDERRRSWVYRKKDKTTVEIVEYSISY